jgi:transcriptional regulator with XRE-family HTH domain
MATLRSLRERKFLTQKELGGLIGVHSTMVSEWERGLYRPSLRNLRKLCELLEVPPDDIDWPETRPKDPAGASPAG